MIDVVTSFGGTLAGPLFVWTLLMCAALLYVTMRWVNSGMLRISRRRKIVLAFGSLLVWSTHFFVVLYTACQAAGRGWLTPWWTDDPVELRTTMYEIGYVGAAMAFFATALLVVASLIVFAQNVDNKSP